MDQTHTSKRPFWSAMPIILPMIALLDILFLGGEIGTIHSAADARGAMPLTVVLLLILASAFITMHVLLLRSERRARSLACWTIDRTALLRFATHQLGMPLVTFKWWLETVRGRAEKFPAGDEACDQLQEGITRLDQVIDSLRDMANLQPDSVHQPATHVALTDVMRDVERQTELQLTHRKQTIVVEVPADLPLLPLNQQLLAGVLRELVENASFYSPVGARILVHARSAYSNVVIDVQDQGCGVPPDDIAKIFQKYSRASNANDHKPNGNGLGLYIAKSIIEHAGGSMWIRSELDKGTTVSFSLPTS